MIVERQLVARFTADESASYCVAGVYLEGARRDDVLEAEFYTFSPQRALVNCAPRPNRWLEVGSLVVTWKHREPCELCRMRRPRSSSDVAEDRRGVRRGVWA